MKTGDMIKYMTNMNLIVKRSVFLLVICLSCCLVYAQKTKRVSATIVYRAPASVSVVQARLTALERAKIQAIADKFGTVVSQTNITRTQTHNGESSMDFSSLGLSEVKGEWVETIGEPEIVTTFEQDMIVVKCTIEGKAREIKSASVEFEAKILRNGTESRFASEEFKDGDRLYLSFQTPKDGYIAVYLIDAEQKAYCLLPYEADTDGQEFVKHGQEYVFFAPKIELVDGFIEKVINEAEGIILGCEDNLEMNQMYIIFSPTPFTKAVDRKDKFGLRSLPQEMFYKWLGECRNLNPEMSVEVKNIQVTK